MNKLKQMPVGRQVFFIFGTLCVILLLIGGLFILSLNELTRYVETDVKETVMTTTRFISEVRIICDVLVAVMILVVVGASLVAVRITRRLKKDNQVLKIEAEERNRTEEALKEAQALYHSLVDQMPAGVFRKDAQGRYVFVNPWFCRMKRATADQLLGKTPRELADEELAEQGAKHPEEIQFMILGASHHELIMKNGRRIEMEEEYSDADGKTVHLQVVKSAVFGPDGKIIGSQGMLFDVTERKQMETDLAYERDLLRSLLDNSPDQIYFKDAQSRFIKCSKAMAVNFGVKDVAALLGKTDFDFFAEEHARPAFEDEQEIIRTGRPIIGRMEKEVWHDGRVSWVLTNKIPLRDKDGQIIGTFGISKDITERQQTEEALQEAQALYHSLVDQMPAGVFRKDAEGRFVFVNSWYCRIKGMTPDQILGKTPRELATTEFVKHPQAAKEIQLAVQGANNHEWIMETGQRIDVEEQYPGADGKMQYWQVVKSPVFSPEEKIIGTQGIFFNITERKQADAALAQERNLLRTMIDNSPDAIYLKDLSGRKTLANPAELKNMGCRTETEAIGKSDFEIYPQELAAGYFADDQAVMQTGQPLINREDKIVTPDGETRWVLSSKIPLRDAAGNITGLVGMGREITERKRFAAQLLQSQKLETVGKLAGGIAHEFNNILTAIIGQSELLLGDLPAGSPLAKGATEISKAAGRAAVLTRQLLAYGRKQLLQPEALDLNRVIAGIEGMLPHLIGGEINAQIVPAPDLHAVEADAGQIEQVIMNMVINARDAMPGGGKLTLETANISFDQESVSRHLELKPGDYVMLAITDTGTGMSEEVKARVFEPFFTTKGVGQGTGLGLSTCYGIIKQSGGHISVASEQGRGTTFKIYLPQIEMPAKVSIPQLDAPELPAGMETILLAEDDAALREMAATLLRRLGYTVLAAGSGLEALSLKHERSPGHIDLLFTNVVMPNMGGKELADRVLALYPRTKILFTSAYTENTILHQGAALLKKPFTPSALARKVREVLDQPAVLPD